MLFVDYSVTVYCFIFSGTSWCGEADLSRYIQQGVW